MNTTARKLTLAEKRDAWMTEVFRGVQPEFTDADANAVLDRIASEAPALGRTERWAAAVRWFEVQRKGSADPKWIVTQGSVYLTHAL